jgi:hypothetical protein
MNETLVRVKTLVRDESAIGLKGKRSDGLWSLMKVADVEQ